MAWMCTNDKERTKGGNLKGPSLSMVITWVKEVWEDISGEMVKKSFRKTGISSSMYGTEDDHNGKIQENHHHQKKNQKKPGTQMSV